MTTMTQADLFDATMRAVWDNNMRDSDDNDLYDKLTDARDVASIFGAKPTNARSAAWDGGATEWLFPDGSTIWIIGGGNGLASNMGQGVVFA